MQRGAGSSLSLSLSLKSRWEETEHSQQAVSLFLAADHYFAARPARESAVRPRARGEACLVSRFSA